LPDLHREEINMLKRRRRASRSAIKTAIVLGAAHRLGKRVEHHAARNAG
jgi:hypothetical protein